MPIFMAKISVVPFRCIARFDLFVALFGLIMQDFFRYLTFNDSDKAWGLHLHVAGTYTARPNSAYPQKEHPGGYYFRWEQGRVLQEYQLVFITEGNGVLETRSESYVVKQGSILLIRPGQWHRYRPQFSTGWTEFYIGFSGSMATHLFQHVDLKELPIVYHSDRQHTILELFHRIIELVRKEEPGVQQVVSGLVVQMLGVLVAQQKQRLFSGKHIETIIQDVRLSMRNRIYDDVSVEQLAEAHHVAYSYFRKMFKRYVGVSPHQYQLDLKVLRARELLVSTDKSITEIAFDLNFQSLQYFTRLFKKKTGISPSDLRNVNRTVPA